MLVNMHVQKANYVFVMTVLQLIAAPNTTISIYIF